MSAAGKPLIAGQCELGHDYKRSGEPKNPIKNLSSSAPNVDKVCGELAALEPESSITDLFCLSHPTG
jgi:hypothetical protein